jgi:cyclase
MTIETVSPRLVRLCLPGLLVFVAATVAPLGAQPSTYRVQQLAPDVYAVLRNLSPGGVADSNVLIVVNQSDVVVVDANILPTSARQVVAEIKKLTPNPVRYVVNTHWHSDHHYGNQVYRDAYPGVEIVQHPTTRSLVISEDVPSLAKNLEVEYPAVIDRLKTALATGKRSNGEPVTEEQRVQFADSLSLYELFMADMKGTPIVPGTLTVADSLVLHRGERTIEIRHLGQGNTPGDLVVYLPNERIVATGDLVVHPVPYAFFSPIAHWPQTLRELAKLDVVAIMPGHGEIQTDWTYVRQLIPLIESTWSQVQQAVAAGADLEATLAAVDVDAFRAAFGGEASREQLDYLFVRPAVEAAYRALRPEAAAEP